MRNSSAVIEWPANCFSWDWDTIYSDKALHIQGKASKIEALFQWLDADPHLTEQGDLVNRATLLQICLGVGIVLGDAHLIQFGEEETLDMAPGYIRASTWNVTQYNKFLNYMSKVRVDLEDSIERSRYVMPFCIRASVLNVTLP